MEEYFVYWYKRPDFTNPYTEGYIGITNNTRRRNLEHRRGTKNLHLTNALNKYDDIEMIILHTCAKAEALELEYMYRPTKNIGWNMAAGGEDTLATLTSVPITLYHKDSYPILHTFSSIYAASEALGIKEGRIGIARIRGYQIYGKDGWAILLDSNFDRSQTPSFNQRIGDGRRGTKRTNPSHFKGVTNRWTEEDKQRIGNQHRGKVISEEAKELVRQANRLNNPSCKSIKLSHISNPDKIYTYHSISTAARELSISLSALKYRVRQQLPITGKDGWTVLSLGSE